jgi:hypothetical protein
MEVSGQLHAPAASLRGMSSTGTDSLRRLWSGRSALVGNRTRFIGRAARNLVTVSRDSSVAIPTGYGLDDQGEREFQSR